MTDFKSLTIWTIVFNFLILAGAGHGLATVGLLEVLSFIGLLTGHSINDGYFSLSLTGSYDQSLGAVALFSFVGQILLGISFMIEGQSKTWAKLIALFLLWMGFYYLIHNFPEESLSQLGLFSGVPFLISSGILTYRLIKEESGPASAKKLR
jgi:hypothetical protein